MGRVENMYWERKEVRLGVKRRKPCSERRIVEDWKTSVSTATVIVVSRPSAKSSSASSVTSESVARARKPRDLRSSRAFTRVEQHESRVGVEGRGILRRARISEPTERPNCVLAWRNVGGGEEEERLERAKRGE